MKEANFGPLIPPVDGLVDGLFRRDKEKQKKDIDTQIKEYFGTFLHKVKFDAQRAQSVYPDVLNIEFAVVPRAETITTEAIHRNNQMADIITSPAFRELLNEQRELRGGCAVGMEICIDGRIADVHTVGVAANVHEEMAGLAGTSISKLSGEIILRSQTIEQAVESRPYQDSCQLLEIGYAHGIVIINPNNSISVTSNCGAMAKFQEEAAARGEPFRTNDLIGENFQLLTPSLEAITRTYNAAAQAAGVPQLERVGVRAVYDTATQGTLLGYGEENPFFSTAILRKYEDELRDDLPRLCHDERLRQPGYFRETFTSIDRYLDKERLTTQIISYLMDHRGFQREMADAAGRLSELQGLTAEQLRALQFKMARSMAFQYLTGLHKQELSPEHPFSRHNERFQAITIDDGYGATVGKHDPEIQVFAANTATITEAVEHVKTKTALMNHYSPQKPYVLFICSGIAENSANDPEVRKQARATVGRTFNGITQNSDIADLIKAGILIPVPAIVSSRNGFVVEVPNLLR